MWSVSSAGSCDTAGSSKGHVFAYDPPGAGEQ